MSAGVCLGLDTSNYTTSVAVFDGSRGRNAGRLLDVPAGALGLRQSEALFQHVKRLPELFAKLREAGELGEIRAVAASTRPRAVEGSYMPCFLVGESQGRSVADTLGVPFFSVSHQQGHIAAAAWSGERMDLLERPFLAWHLSGGTTELLYVEPEGVNVAARKIGGTSDISAGQLIDRTGAALGLSFPAGKAVDELAGRSRSEECFPVKLTDRFTFSLSGMENKSAAMAAKGREGADVAAFVLNTISDVVRRATAAAQREYPGLPVLCSGGVASNRRLRQVLTQSCQAVFAQPQYASDNAMGVAILASRLADGGGQR